MNLKSIIKLFVLLFLLISCSKIEILNKNNIELESIQIDEMENQDTISNFNFVSYENFVDYYSRNINFKWNNSKNLEKTFILSIGKNSKTDLNVSNLIIDNDYIYFINDKSFFSKIDLLEGNIIYEIELDVNFEPDLYLPISLAKIDNFFFAGFANGTIIKFNESGEINWRLDFKDLLRTPIKIHNNNIIAMFNSNRILSINSEDGSLMWQYYYELNKSSSSKGGMIFSKGNILFLIMPNGRLGTIDTIIGEKIELNHLSKVEQQSINNYNYEANIHVNDILFIFFENKNTIYTFDTDNEVFFIFNDKISSISSYGFINNALLTLDNNYLLKSYNLINKKIFWQTDLSDVLSKKDKIVQSFVINDNLIIFFSKGIILQLNIFNGEITYKQNLKLNEIAFISSYNENFAISLKDGKIIFYKQ